MSLAYLRLFGGVRLDAGDGDAASGRAVQRKRLALLALLGTSPTGRLSRDKATAFLWPDSDAERARHQRDDRVMPVAPLRCGR